MTIFTRIFRCLCLCVVIQKGSWSPQGNSAKPKKDPSNCKAIIKKRFKDTKFKEKSEKIAKPEWLKQWTISKGWMHNRSHMLNLGVETNSSENLVMDTPKPTKKLWDEESQSSSVSIDNIDDLISVISNIETSSKKRDNEPDFDKIEVIQETEDISEMFSQISENYRKNFPDTSKYIGRDDIQLPEVYKERILNQNSTNFFQELWNYLKPKFRRKLDQNCKFTVNELYDPAATSIKPDQKRNSLGENITMKNTLNFKTNLHEQTIYECSEESLSLYNNPIYASTQAIENIKPTFYDFHSNHVCKPNGFLSRKKKKGEDSFKCKVRTEKYIIRHIKVRIMLSLRIGRFQKFCKRDGRGYGSLLRRRRSGDVSGQFLRGECVDNEFRLGVSRMHEEQRRIGNGKTSIKIQNMRYL